MVHVYDSISFSPNRILQIGRGGGGRFSDWINLNRIVGHEVFMEICVNGNPYNKLLYEKTFILPTNAHNSFARTVPPACFGCYFKPSSGS
jgi:hypothetical protein